MLEEQAQFETALIDSFGVARSDQIASQGPWSFQVFGSVVGVNAEADSASVGTVAAEDQEPFDKEKSSSMPTAAASRGIALKGRAHPVAQARQTRRLYQGTQHLVAPALRR